MSFNLYAHSSLHHVSKHDLILRINQFKDVRCKKWGDLTIVSKSTVIFVTISAWCQSLWIFQCNGFRNWLQILQPDRIIENSFSKVSRYFPILRKACFLYYLRAALKKLAFNSSAIICYVMKTKNKVFHPSPEHTVKSHLAHQMNDFLSLQ